jgi:hypothetical protein
MLFLTAFSVQANQMMDNGCIPAAERQVGAARHYLRMTT